jgi:hypothetical protein
LVLLELRLGVANTSGVHRMRQRGARVATAVIGAMRLARRALEKAGFDPALSSVTLYRLL